MSFSSIFSSLKSYLIHTKRWTFKTFPKYQNADVNFFVDNTVPDEDIAYSYNFDDTRLKSFSSSIGGAAIGRCLFVFL